MLYSLGAFCALVFCGLVYVFVKIGNVVIKWIGLGIITIILIILIATTFTKVTGFVGNLPEIVKEIKVEIFNIQSEIGGVRGEILLIRSDIAKIDILKWSIVIIITVISLIFLLITV